MLVEVVQIQIFDCCIFIVNMHINAHFLGHTPQKEKESRNRKNYFVHFPDKVNVYIYYLQHAIVTIILNNVVLIKNFIFFRDENLVEFVYNANIIPSDVIVVIAKKHFIVIQIY
jgi:hypothetical protein